MYDTTKPFKKEIQRIIKTTWRSPNPPASSVDGIGTKPHWQMRTFRSAAGDALAMNLNDLLVLRAEARELYDHIILPRDDNEAVYEIVQALADEAIKRGIEIYSGETAIRWDIGGLEIGIVLRGEAVPSRCRGNIVILKDAVVGLASNGLHANGFTLVRETLGMGTLRPEYAAPTCIYSDIMLPLLQKYAIHGMAHVTGGAFTKILDVLDSQRAVYSAPVDVCIYRARALQPHPIFFELCECGISDYEMYRTFNCGIGFLVFLPEGEAGQFVKEFPAGAAAVIGEVVYGLPNGGRGRVCIESAFSDSWVVYE